MPVCFFNSKPNGEYLNLLILRAFSNSLFFLGKTPLPVKNSCNAEILADFLSKSY